MIFSTLYTTLSYNLIKDKLIDLNDDLAEWNSLSYQVHFRFKGCWVVVFLSFKF